MQLRRPHHRGVLTRTRWRRDKGRIRGGRRPAHGHPTCARTPTGVRAKALVATLLLPAFPAHEGAVSLKDAYHVAVSDGAPTTTALAAYLVVLHVDEAHLAEGVVAGAIGSGGALVRGPQFVAIDPLLHHLNGTLVQFFPKARNLRVLLCQQ